MLDLDLSRFYFIPHEARVKKCVIYTRLLLYKKKCKKKSIQEKCVIYTSNPNKMQIKQII